MQMVEKDLLYVDTDSIVFVQRDGEAAPQTGNFLGDLTDELKPGRYIREFVSLGPKSYSYQLDDLSTVAKVKGFTINGQTEKFVNFDNLLRMLIDRQVVSVPYPNVLKRIKRKFEIEQCDTAKRLRFTYGKRRVNCDFTTLPFGYCT